MEFSKRGEYALRALIDLEIASELGRPMPSHLPIFDRWWEGLKKFLHPY